MNMEIDMTFSGGTRFGIGVASRHKDRSRYKWKDLVSRMQKHIGSNIAAQDGLSCWKNFR